MKESSKKKQLYENLRKEITNGDIKPGSIINEEEIAAKYNVSRTPVREALLILAHDGLVTSLPRTGHMVSNITVRDIREIFELRECLEIMAIRLAVKRISFEELSQLERFSEELSNHNDNDVRNEHYLELNKQFHLLIAQASGNTRLQNLIRQVLDDNSRIYKLDPQLSTESGLFEHHEIIRAFKEKNVEKAIAAMKYHIDQVNNRILAQV